MVASGVAEDQVPQIKRNPWADNFFRPLLITIMIMCFNISLVNLVRMINPAWRGTYFLMGMLLTTIEAIYSYRVLRLLRSRGISLLRYRLAELTVLILLLKILSWAGTPIALIWAELQTLWHKPGNFVDLEFYALFTLALIAWLAASNTMANFEELHDPYTFRSDNILPLDNLASRFFWGGIILVFISGITQWISRAGWPSLADFQRPSLSGVILNVLVYFTLGLVLLSQAHLTTLLVRWQVQKISVASDLARQWAKYGFLFLGLIMLAVFFLPTRYTLGFLASAALVIQFLLNLITFLIELLLFLISLPLLWFFSLLGQSPQNLSGVSSPPLLPESPAQVSPIPWLEALRSLIFWLLAIAIAGYFLKAYLEDHPELRQALTSFKPVGLLLKLLAQLWQQLWGLAQAGLELIPQKFKPTGPAADTAPKQRWGWFRPGQTSAREQIMYYYLNILKRAEQTGPARKAHQTPYEYEPELSQAVPEVQAEVNLLTKAFIHARYSQGPFHQAQAGLAKTLWQQIRRELRHLSKSGKTL